jgi:acetyl-CoA carboxylase biotin carboxyl carrier protein
MNLKEIRELIDYLIEKDIAEFELERGDVRVRIRRGGEIHVVQAAASPAVMPSAAVEAAATLSGTSAPRPAKEKEEEGLHIVRSPIVGTYYEAPAPGAPPYVKVGDKVSNGQVVAIIEAMKLMNEIEADAAGEITRIYAKNGQPVEYGQPLFAIRTG